MEMRRKNLRERERVRRIYESTRPQRHMGPLRTFKLHIYESTPYVIQLYVISACIRHDGNASLRIRLVDS